MNTNDISANINGMINIFKKVELLNCRTPLIDPKYNHLPMILCVLFPYAFQKFM